VARVAVKIEPANSSTAASSSLVSKMVLTAPPRQRSGAGVPPPGRCIVARIKAPVHGPVNGVVSALALSKSTMRNIRQNLFFALVYNGIGIPVAAGALYPLLGWRVSPMHPEPVAATAGGER